jgi:hypothetical protein
MARRSIVPAGAVAKRRRRSAAEWATEVATWKASGQTAKEYARRRGLCASTLTWWSSRGTGSTPGATTFLPVRVVTRGTPVAVVVRAEVVLRSGRTVRLLGDLPLDQLARLLDAVEGGTRC